MNEKLIVFSCDRDDKEGVSKIVLEMRLRGVSAVDLYSYAYSYVAYAFNPDYMRSIKVQYNKCDRVVTSIIVREFAYTGFVSRKKELSVNGLTAGDFHRAVFKEILEHSFGVGYTLDYDALAANIITEKRGH